MKPIKFVAVGVMCAVLPSCGLLKSAGRMPGSLMKSVGRTAGMNVNHVEPTKSDREKQEEEAKKIY